MAGSVRGGMRRGGRRKTAGMESSSSDNTYGEAIYDGGIPELYKIPIPIPLPCIGEAAARVSPSSSPARSEASRCAPCYAADAEPDPVPQVEASVGRNTQLLLAMDAMGGRSGYYGRRPASSYGSCAAGPICSPVSSRGGGGTTASPAPQTTTPRSSRHRWSVFFLSVLCLPGVPFHCPG
ncbi:uncharacterized protein LOC120667783 [Panicum virgatum]|uniref:uncharacterized protein LOC120667783 n=1 Tax=Panicum virgatum TaxID=38727 RepID=UPI0019D6A826|nr:uncharacterized protein LOC120667783 [Panicum virgatum]